MSAALALEEPVLFHSARSALLFALTRQGAPAPPAMTRMIKTVSDHDFVDRGLPGLDGAAQAGMIMGVLKPLGSIAIAALVASCAPRWTPCGCKRACCAGRTIGLEWRHAIEDLSHETVNRRPVRDADGVVRYRSLLPPATRQDYRAAIVMKAMGESIPLSEIAKNHSVDDETTARHHRLVLRWLKGPRGSAQDDGPEGIEPWAWRGAETLLRDAGIVG